VIVTVIPLATAAGRYTGADVVYPNHSELDDHSVGHTTAFRWNDDPDGHGEPAHDHTTIVDDSPGGSAVVVDASVVDGAVLVVGDCAGVVGSTSLLVDAASVVVGPASVVVVGIVSLVGASAVVGTGGRVVAVTVEVGAASIAVVAGSVVAGGGGAADVVGSVGGALADACASTTLKTGIAKSTAATQMRHFGPRTIIVFRELPPSTRV
jgi:hypothetical protein